MQKILMTARSGQKVWVPIEKAEQFRKAQQSPPSVEEMTALRSGVRSALENLIKEAQGRSE